MTAALELAGTLAGNGPLALIAANRILQEKFDWSSGETWERQAVLSGPGRSPGDANKGCDRSTD